MMATGRGHAVVGLNSVRSCKGHQVMINKPQVTRASLESNKPKSGERTTQVGKELGYVDM